jgi:hypothetical protein
MPARVSKGAYAWKPTSSLTLSRVIDVRRFQGGGLRPGEMREWEGRTSNQARALFFSTPGYRAPVVAGEGSQAVHLGGADGNNGVVVRIQDFKKRSNAAGPGAAKTLWRTSPRNPIAERYIV